MTQSKLKDTHVQGVMTLLSELERGATVGSTGRLRDGSHGPHIGRQLAPADSTLETQGA